MISAKQFLTILERKDLLPAKLLVSMRRQIDASDKQISAELVAKKLIDTGYLTPALARRLLLSAESTAAEVPVEETPPKSSEQTEPERTDSELGFAPTEECIRGEWPVVMDPRKNRADGSRP